MNSPFPRSAHISLDRPVPESPNYEALEEGVARILLQCRVGQPCGPHYIWMRVATDPQGHYLEGQTVPANRYVLIAYEPWETQC